MRRIIKMFEDGNVSVSGLRGTGKDMLMANVVVRRGLPYISNINYGGAWIPFDPAAINCHNTYRDFLSGKLNRYVYPYADRIDFYLTDLGIYLPAQFFAQLNNDYGYISTFVALTRQLGECNFHMNSQAPERVWSHLREQSDQYLRCMWCFTPMHYIRKYVKNEKLRDFLLNLPVMNLVVQKVIRYELYESLVRRVPPFRLRKPWFNPDRIQQWEIQKSNYDISFGLVEPMILVYFNRSNYNTRVFKEMLANAPECYKPAKAAGA